MSAEIKTTASILEELIEQYKSILGIHAEKEEEVAFLKKDIYDSLDEIRAASKEVPTNYKGMSEIYSDQLLPLLRQLRKTRFRVSTVEKVEDTCCHLYQRTYSMLDTLLDESGQSQVRSCVYSETRVIPGMDDDDDNDDDDIEEQVSPR